MVACSSPSAQTTDLVPDTGELQTHLNEMVNSKISELTAFYENKLAEPSNAHESKLKAALDESRCCLEKYEILAQKYCALLQSSRDDLTSDDCHDVSEQSASQSWAGPTSPRLLMS
eukprot:TRINITY_DN61064_c0_g1_i1.p1 TRINITY_DN61064_c0_g1~~TRINITY_DN61064_c0_g1_i1.p1  ORF type:complete len:126 (-),score=16.73 TRINITY_DN61064_c0_g1_i1:122-469(-)